MNFDHRQVLLPIYDIAAFFRSSAVLAFVVLSRCLPALWAENAAPPVVETAHDLRETNALVEKNKPYESWSTAHHVTCQASPFESGSVFCCYTCERKWATFKATFYFFTIATPMPARYSKCRWRGYLVQSTVTLLR